MTDIGKVRHGDVRHGVDVLKDIEKLNQKFQPVKADARITNFFGNAIQKVVDSVRQVENFFITGMWQSNEEKALPTIRILVTQLGEGFKETAKVYKDKGGDIGNLREPYHDFVKTLITQLGIMKNICADWRQTEKGNVAASKVQEVERQIEQLIGECADQNAITEKQMRRAEERIPKGQLKRFEDTWNAAEAKKIAAAGAKEKKTEKKEESEKESGIKLSNRFAPLADLEEEEEGVEKEESLPDLPIPQRDESFEMKLSPQIKYKEDTIQPQEKETKTEKPKEKEIKIDKKTEKAAKAKPKKAKAKPLETSNRFAALEELGESEGPVEKTKQHVTKNQKKVRQKQREKPQSLEIFESKLEAEEPKETKAKQKEQPATVSKQSKLTPTERHPLMDIPIRDRFYDIKHKIDLLVRDKEVLQEGVGREKVKNFTQFLNATDWFHADEEDIKKQGKTLITAIYATVNQPLPEQFNDLNA